MEIGALEPGRIIRLLGGLLILCQQEQSIRALFKMENLSAGRLLSRILKYGQTETVTGVQS